MYTLRRRRMDKEKFNRAIELNKKIEEYKSHKTALESCNIKYGGGLIFTYNRMHNDVPLKEERMKMKTSSFYVNMVRFLTVHIATMYGSAWMVISMIRTKVIRFTLQ